MNLKKIINFFKINMLINNNNLFLVINSNK